MSAQKRKDESWDVESIFDPPKHDFGKGHDNDNDDDDNGDGGVREVEEEQERPITTTTTTQRVSPPRFLGKKRKGPPGAGAGCGGRRTSLSSQSSGYGVHHQETVFRGPPSKPNGGDDDDNGGHDDMGTTESEDRHRGNDDVEQDNIFRSPSRSYEERQDGSGSANANANAASSSSSSSSSFPSYETPLAPPQSPSVTMDDTFPIKFSLSHEFKSDASFSDYLGDGSSLMMGPSPRGSPMPNNQAHNHHLCGTPVRGAPGSSSSFATQEVAVHPGNAYFPSPLMMMNVPG
eukprot:CAMPEP_0181133056 /NCGR_PEP_ID=MMETSP1071-20121207/31327_1 /TAXON_ID=35127 /ORGANISM="Thalassiosira sp., Strain NH16" /LENGTH=289 /DNA_ID=CAMNT_0023219435 /DNA_START=365 /DNA_END=1231 /DNA_ORIENTATION=-